MQIAPHWHPHASAIPSASPPPGAFSLPLGCSSGPIELGYDSQGRLTFKSPRVAILAVITKDGTGAMTSYYGSGTTQGRLRHKSARAAELCFLPVSGTTVSVAASAVYATGMQPGTASWSFAKSVALSPPYADGRAIMFNGDSADATWTLTARKSGTDVNYQGVVSGTITISNPTPTPISVTSVVNQMTGGPMATVACPRGLPLSVAACDSVTCQYTAYYPKAPAAGVYSASAQIQYQVGSEQACLAAGFQALVSFEHAGWRSPSALPAPADLLR